MKLWNLIEKSRLVLIQSIIQNIRKKLNLILSRDEKFKKLNLNETIFKIDHLIKFFHSIVRFVIKSDLNYVMHDSFSEISVRRHFDVNVIQIYIEVFKNCVLNWIYNFFQIQNIDRVFVLFTNIKQKNKFTKKNYHSTFWWIH